MANKRAKKAEEAQAPGQEIVQETQTMPESVNAQENVGPHLYMKKTTNDSLFTKMFSDRKNLCEFFRESIDPNDRDVKPEDFEILTIENVFTDQGYNDLGFLVRRKRLILVECQTRWDYNAVLRFWKYALETLERYNASIGRKIGDGGGRINLPETMELFLVYIGEKGSHPDIITLATQNGMSGSIQVSVKVLYFENTETLIGQYTRFCRVYAEKRKELDSFGDAFAATLKVAKAENLLQKYLDEHSGEVRKIMEYIDRQEEMVDAYVQQKMNQLNEQHQQELQSKDEHYQRELQKEKESFAADLVRQGLLSVSQGAKQLGLSEVDFERIVTQAAGA